MTKHAAAVLGIGLIAMGEEIGSEMAFRTFGHLVSFCSLLTTPSRCSDCYVRSLLKANLPGFEFF